MTEFTELMPATKSSPHNALTWVPRADDHSPAAGVLEIRTKRVYVTYTVAEFPTHWRGRGFSLRKADGSETYSVFCSADGPAADSCDCAGSSYTGKCKHKDAIRTLVLNGWI